MTQLLRARWSAPKLLLSLILSVSVLLPLPRSAFAQIEQGATMTILRGQVAIIRADGTALQPAPSGTLVYAGDEIRTLAPGGALVTFFVGTELELLDNTVIVVEQAERDGMRVAVSLKQVLGMTINRVETFAHPGSMYRVDAGGAVALVRG
jgi:hypothetical protein